MAFREELLCAKGCSFSAVVTADYGDMQHTFTMDCQGDSAGNVTFKIKEPSSIAGIQGKIDSAGGKISFEDQYLYFPLLTDDLLTPASAPWIFLKTLRSGYITSVCTEGEMLHISVNDSYEDDALYLDIWLLDSKPIRADILHDGKRILSVQVEHFAFL